MSVSKWASVTYVPSDNNYSINNCGKTKWVCSKTNILTPHPQATDWSIVQLIEVYKAVWRESAFAFDLILEKVLPENQAVYKEQA